MIFDLLTTPLGPRGQGQKIAAVCPIHVSNSQTKFGLIWEKLYFWTPTPQYPHPTTPGAWPRQLNENPVWYIFISSICEKANKVWFKTFEIDFVIEI